jgi:hypothetical protein
MNKIKALVVTSMFFLFSVSAGAADENQVAPDSQYKNWEFIANKDGLKTFQRDTEQGIVGFRGETVMDATIEQIATVLADMPSRKKWMDEVVEARRVRMNSIFDRVEYNHTAVPWPFQNRDFVYSAKVAVDTQQKTMTITMQSVEDAELPPKDGIVRGQMHLSRYFLKSLDGGKKTFVTVEIIVDPKGAIPKWIVRLKQKKWPRNTLTGLGKYIASNRIEVPKEFQVFAK